MEIYGSDRVGTQKTTIFFELSHAGISYLAPGVLPHGRIMASGK